MSELLNEQPQRHQKKGRNRPPALQPFPWTETRKSPAGRRAAQEGAKRASSFVVRICGRTVADGQSDLFLRARGDALAYYNLSHLPLQESVRSSLLTCELGTRACTSPSEWQVKRSARRSGCARAAGMCQEEAESGPILFRLELHRRQQPH